LHELYSKVKNYGNVKLIVSCRTSDFNSFRRIIEFFDIKIFEVSEIDNREISKISEQFPVIASMNSLGKYKELLKTPLYIDIIVKQAENIDKIENESQLRDYIWSNIITLRGKTQRYNLKHNNVVEVIEKIVFDRAKRFLLGSNIKQYDSKIVDALLSENVIIKNRETIRLKLDLFEDIVFERFFDEKFEECKGDFNLFFKNIGEMGRSGFRRYQIWVSNKLLVKENRNKFLANILFSEKTPKFWKRQTYIGLIKSRHSEEFFIEYKNLIISKGLLVEFVNITNLYGFEIDNNNIKNKYNIFGHMKNIKLKMNYIDLITHI